MGKYSDWTRGEDEALLNIAGGVEIARAVLRGEKKLTIEDVRTPTKPVEPASLVGTLVKTVVLKPYNAKSVAKAIKLGKYSDVISNDIAEIFAEDGASLDKETRIDLYQFDRDSTSEEVLDWAKANGDKKPICPAHIYAIGIQHSEIQRLNSVVEIGSVRSGYVLYLFGSSVLRYLSRDTFRYGWGRNFLFGFVSE